MIGLGGGGGGRLSVGRRIWCVLRRGFGGATGIGCVQTSTMLSGASYAGGGVIGRLSCCRGRCFLTDCVLGTASMCGGLSGASGCKGLRRREGRTLFGGKGAVRPKRA